MTEEKINNEIKSDVPLGMPAEPKSPERIAFEERLKSMNDPITLDKLRNILDSTIKFDNNSKIITFLLMLLNYTEEDQQNIGYNAESSTGKSYIPLELTWYFPQEDVIELGYVSPQAFFHEQGIFDKERKVRIIDYEQKIVVFMDMPHDQLLHRIRPLLSHDRKILTSKITDKKERYGTRTETTEIIGYPSVIFCTAKFSMDDQERTRMLLLSPETDQEKLKAGILLRIEKECDREAFRAKMEDNSDRQHLAGRVAAIKTASIHNILIPDEYKNRIGERFLENRVRLLPRHQRDISRLMALIKACALFNYQTHERVETAISRSIIATTEDIESGFRLYEGIRESNELGLAPETYEVYQKIAPNITDQGITKNDFSRAYFDAFGKPLSSKRRDEMLNLFCSVGILSDELDPNDKRRALYTKIKYPSTRVQQKTAYPSQRVFNFDDFIEVKRVLSQEERECAVCGYVKPTDAQATTNKGETLAICESCFMEFNKKREASP
jgi:hypothetical protein